MNAVEEKPASTPEAPMATEFNQVPLKPEDFIPFFRSHGHYGNDREIQLHAGKYCALFFIPPTDTKYLTTLFEEISRQRKKFSSLQVHHIFVTPLTCSDLLEVTQRLNIIHTIWADSYCDVGNAFGLYHQASLNFTPISYLLSPNLKIIGIHRGDIPAGHIQKILDGCPEQTRDQHAEITGMHAPVSIIPDALSAARCALLINEWTSGETFEGKIGADSKSTYRSSAKISAETMVEAQTMELLDSTLSGTVFPEIEKVFGMQVTYREEYKISRYSTDKVGFFTRRRDNFDAPLAYRRFAMTLNLNDEYDGGGINFPEYSPSAYKPPGVQRLYSPVP